MLVTAPLVDVVDALLADADARDTGLHGFAIAKITRRPKAAVYAVLERLAARGLATGQWVEPDPQARAPRRQVFRLTPDGVAYARSLLDALQPASDTPLSRNG
jgi:PadR family transcriptional regulator, regulatory protein PadR